MKKFLISFLFLFTFSLNLLYSQSLVVSGDTIVSGNANTQLENHFDVVNNSNVDLNVVCRKTEISVSTGSTQFCFAVNCYNGSLSDTALILAGQSVDPVDAHTGYYNSFGATSAAVVEYCFYDAENPSDETCRTITYDALILSNVEEVINSEEIGSFYPNPTNEYTNLFYNVKGISVLQITDILGNVVKNIELEGSGEKTIYVGDLHKGIYFGNLVKNGEIVKIKKLIINK